MEFTDEMVQKAWEKGNTVTDFNPDQFRIDDFGTWIMRAEYGNRLSGFGWKIVRIDPKGGDDINNLKPVQWGNI